MGCMATNGPRTESAGRPNVVFILSDDHGLDGVGCYGSDRRKGRTPNLDALAAGGIRFERCYSTPLRAGKGTIYEGGIRACAFATWPGRIPAGLIISEPIHVVDWYPTLLTLAGASLDQELAPDGLNVWPMLTQGAKSPHDAILLAGNVPSKMAIRMGDWKLLLDPGGQDSGETVPASDGAAAKVELYNLAEDVGESKNLAASQPERVTQMRARLDNFLKDAVPPGQEAGATKPPAPRAGAATTPR